MTGIQVTRTQVIVNSAELYNPGGAVDRWMRTIKGEMLEVARNLAPPDRTSSIKYPALREAQSTGALRASIYTGQRRIGTHRIDVVVGASAPHAKYVLNGTGAQGTRYIYSTLGYTKRADINSWIKSGFFEFGEGESGLVMKLPPAPGIGNHLMLRVRGQRANPFLTDAYTVVARRHDGMPRKRFARTLF